jgi:hypothetical protein
MLLALLLFFLHCCFVLLVAQHFNLSAVEIVTGLQLCMAPSFPCFSHVAICPWNSNVPVPIRMILMVTTTLVPVIHTTTIAYPSAFGIEDSLDWNISALCIKY